MEVLLASEELPRKGRKDEAAQAGEPQESKLKRFMEWARRHRTLLLLVGAVVSLALVFGIGFYQFSYRARTPIDIVKNQPVHGTDVSIGDGILDFVKAQGVKVVSEGFKPNWGAEQVGDTEWVVSYVFEVGRQSHWLSWRVNTKTGTIVPRNALSRQVLEGKP